MNTKDLEIFLVLADTQNMQQAASQYDIAPSVLSKSLKRLERELGVQLFDRVGKHIKLNDFGVKFRTSAAKIVAQTKQSIVECSGLYAEQSFRIAAPSIVLFRWASVVSKSLLSSFPNCGVNFHTVYEQQALTQVLQGKADAALITSAIVHLIPKEMHVVSFGQLAMRVAAARNHPLLNGDKAMTGKYATSIKEIYRYSFVSPNISPFCGEHRGIGCDGWPNELHHRKLGMMVNDYGVLGQLVKSGQVLAYLPDYWLRELGLVEIDIVDEQVEVAEQILFVSYQSNLTDLFNDSASD